MKPERGKRTVSAKQAALKDPPSAKDIVFNQKLPQFGSEEAKEAKAKKGAKKAEKEVLKLSSFVYCTSPFSYLITHPHPHYPYFEFNIAALAFSSAISLKNSLLGNFTSSSLPPPSSSNFAGFVL